MSTTTVIDPSREVHQMAPIDEAALAAERELRFRERRDRIESDPHLDPRVKVLYLDRTIWTSGQCADELGIDKHRVYTLRGGRASTRRQPPHPSALPPMDTVEGYVANVPSPGVEAGAVREWAVKRGTHALDPVTGRLTKKPPTHGRARLPRIAQGKPNATITNVQEALNRISQKAGLDLDQAGAGRNIETDLLRAGRRYKVDADAIRAALLRIAYPDASLRELGEMLQPPRTKPQVAALLQRLVAQVDRMG